MYWKAIPWNGLHRQHHKKVSNGSVNTLRRWIKGISCVHGNALHTEEVLNDEHLLLGFRPAARQAIW